MREWLFSVIGIVFLAILFDLIYPDGKTNMFCKGIFGIISIAVMLTPVFNLKDFDFNKDMVSEEFVVNINNSKEEVLCIQIESLLESMGISGASVEIDCNMSDNDIVIENVYVDVSSVVLSENITNINKYEVIVNEVSNKFGIESERVYVYG